jgi:peptide/nickel transport system substrate-binding protein
MACNGMNFAGWPCDEKAEALRQAALDADPAHHQAALDALHSYLAQVEPYTVLGQYDQPVALRTNVTGFLQSPVIVYWNLDKN